MAIQYTKKSFIERVRLHLADGFPADEFNISNNQMLLYIDAGIASAVVASMLGMAKLTGQIATPEAYILTTQLPALVKNEITNEWETTLPQTPLSLSIGYSISNAYFGDPALGESETIWLIKNKRSAYRNYLPTPVGTQAKVRGSKISIRASDGSSLYNIPVYVDMVTTRTSDVNAPMNLPDDIIDLVFQKVVTECRNRMSIPMDVIKDDIGSGATNVKP